MGKIFRGGVPYKLDVKRLTEAFPVPFLTEGRMIKHEDLEPVVNAPKGSQRYYAVVNSWLIETRNTTGIYGVWEPGVGIKILDPAGILTFGETRTRQKINQTRRALKIPCWADRTRLDAMGQQRIDHWTRVTAVLEDNLKSAHKQMAIELSPIKSLPKPKLIRDAS